jgi:hypothetical protein
MCCGSFPSVHVKNGSAESGIVCAPHCSIIASAPLHLQGQEMGMSIDPLRIVVLHVRFPSLNI